MFALPLARHRFAACQVGGGSNRFYAFDPQGSTSALVGSGGQLLGRGCFSPYGSAELTQQMQQSAFGYKGQSGAYQDNEVSNVIAVGGQAYVPSAPMYTAPVGLQGGNPYQPMGGNPLDSTPVEADNDDDFPLNPDGSVKAYAGVQQGIHGLANHLADTLDFLVHVPRNGVWKSRP